MDVLGVHVQLNSEEVRKKEQLEEVTVSPSLRLWWIYLFGFACVLAVKLLLLFELSAYEWAWRATVFVGTLTLLYLFIKIKLTIYRLNAIEFIAREGVFSTRLTRIPLNRITNYHLHASFLDRLLGLNSLLIDTPGSAGYELTLKDLCEREARLLSERLRELLAQQKIADAGDNEQLRAQRQRAMIGKETLQD